MRWPVFRVYLSGERVVEDRSGGPTRIYDPMEEAGLIERFARIKTRDDLLSFAAEYGLLGLWSFALRQQRQTPTASEPARWWLAHAQGVRIVLGAIRFLNSRRTSSPDGLGTRYGFEALWTSHPDEVLEPSDKAPTVGFGRYVGRLGFVLSRDWEDTERVNPRERARRVAATILNKNLEGVPRRFSPFPPTRAGSRSAFEIRTLVEAIYWRLANEWDAGRVRSCEACGEPFIASHGRQQYCPPPPGHAESPCAARLRKRRQRAM